MNPYGVVIAGLSSGIPSGAVAAVLGPGFAPAELLAGLGAAVVATLGILIVRELNVPSERPAAVAPSLHPQDDGVKRAA